MGARHTLQRYLTPQVLFQSTCPAWGATHWSWCSQYKVSISIHVPRVGRDLRYLHNVPYYWDFNPRARVGRDPFRLFRYRMRYIFQSTRPRGARLLHCHSLFLRFLFQSTRPRGARRRQAGEMLGVLPFQSTRPRGARRQRESLCQLVQHFNPRARVGRDPSEFTSFVLSAISIHAPAWGATLAHSVFITSFFISIHAPAWGATCCSRSIATRLTFQSTRPRGARHACRQDGSLRLEFQSTRPRGARLADVFAYTITNTFQSTRPRGARL